MADEFGTAERAPMSNWHHEVIHGERRACSRPEFGPGALSLPKTSSRLESGNALLIAVAGTEAGRAGRPRGMVSAR
jgi:hypothetical protein